MIIYPSSSVAQVTSHSIATMVRGICLSLWMAKIRTILSESGKKKIQMVECSPTWTWRACPTNTWKTPKIVFVIFRNILRGRQCTRNIQIKIHQWRSRHQCQNHRWKCDQRRTWVNHLWERKQAKLIWKNKWLLRIQSLKKNSSQSQKAMRHCPLYRLPGRKAHQWASRCESTSTCCNRIILKHLRLSF